MAISDCKGCGRSKPIIPGASIIACAHVKPHRSPRSPNGFRHPCEDNLHTREFIEEQCNEQGLSLVAWQERNLATFLDEQG